jgi:hypothetical protein
MDRALFIVFCGAAAFDFRSDLGASSTVQMCLGIMACIAFGLLMMNTRRPPRDLPLLRRMTWLWWIYLASSMMVAILRGVAPLHYLRTIFPYLLLGEGMIIGYFLLAEREENAARMFRVLFYTAAISSIVFLIKGFSTGRPMEELRYLIISPLLTVLFAFATFRLIFEGVKAGWMNYGALALAMGIMFLSVSRTFILCLLAIIVAVIYSVVRPPAWLGSRLRRSILVQMLRGAIIVPLLAVGLFFVFPNILGRWTDRSSIVGTQDPTALTRIAEAAWELEAMTSDASHFVLGSGIGSDHGNDPRFLLGVVEAKEEASAAHVYFPGHIVWPYELFASGIVMGWVLLVMFLVAIWRGCSRQSSYISRMAAIAVLAVLVESTLGNILFYRGGGIGLGLLFALCLYGPGKQRKARGGNPSFRGRLRRDSFNPNVVHARDIPFKG